MACPIRTAGGMVDSPVVLSLLTLPAPPVVVVLLADVA